MPQPHVHRPEKIEDPQISSRSQETHRIAINIETVRGNRKNILKFPNQRDPSDPQIKLAQIMHQTLLKLGKNIMPKHGHNRVIARFAEESGDGLMIFSNNVIARSSLAY